MSTTTQVSITELRQQLAGAQARQRDLEYELKNIDADISEAAKTAAKQRAEAARAGESVAHVAADLDLDHLRRRKQELPYETWAAKLTTAQIAKDLHAAELAEAETESRKASDAFSTAQRQLREAEEVRDRAYSRSSAAGARVNNLRRQLREDAKTIQRFENEAPDA